MDFGTSVIEFPFMKPASDPSAKTFASGIQCLNQQGRFPLLKKTPAQDGSFHAI